MSNCHFWLQRFVLNCCEITAVEQSIPTTDISGLVTLLLRELNYNSQGARQPQSGGLNITVLWGKRVQTCCSGHKFNKKQFEKRRPAEGARGYLAIRNKNCILWR